MTRTLTADVMSAEPVPCGNIVQRVLAVLEETPCDAAEVGRRCGLSRLQVSSRLTTLVKRGKALRVGYGLFVLKGSGTVSSLPADAVARPQPVRDQILAFLTEPRQAFEVAAHTGRRTSTITGHMRAMLKLGLVKRVGYGRYARADSSTALPSADALVRPHPVGEQVLRFLDQPRHVQEIAVHLQRSLKKTRQQLRGMELRGLVRCIQPQVFTRIRYGELILAPNQEVAAAA